jgi:hypothetical protein
VSKPIEAPLHTGPRGDVDFFDRHTKEIRRLYGTLPIEDARADFLVHVVAADQEEGEPGNPNTCMFSRACKRAFGSHAVLFYPTVAYVDMLDPHDNSRRVVFRFKLPTKTRKRLEEFDLGRGAVAEATFLLKAVSPSQRLAATRRKQRQRVREIAAGKREVSPERSAIAKRGHETRRRANIFGIRSGTGQIPTSSNSQGG